MPVKAMALPRFMPCTLYIYSHSYCKFTDGVEAYSCANHEQAAPAQGAPLLSKQPTVSGLTLVSAHILLHGRKLSLKGMGVGGGGGWSEA